MCCTTDLCNAKTIEEILEEKENNNDDGDNEATQSAGSKIATKFISNLLAVATFVVACFN